MKKKLLFIVLLVFAFANSLMAQEEAEHHEDLKGAHRLTVGLGHTHISEGIKEGETTWMTFASWSFNYDYWLSNKFALGLQNDVILESFLIENNDEELIEREYPWSVVPVMIYKPGKHLSLIGGVGAEISKGDTLGLTRLGTEYGFHLPKQWELGVSFVWDFKWNHYNSWGLGITISKIWNKKD